jgi:organic hydroperoxide reductase OsmC/OhrA
MHTYTVTTTWTGNQGTGTSDYRSYSRDHTLSTPGPSPILASSDPSFRGDPERWNPEQLLVSALSDCHMLWYLHLCAVGGVVVESYVDEAVGVLATEKSGSGEFTDVLLRPRVVVTSADMVDKARSLHEKANEMCFIARSVNFPVRHAPRILVSGFVG